MLPAASPHKKLWQQGGLRLNSISFVNNRHDCLFGVFYNVCVLQPVYLTDFGTKGADLKGIYYLRNVVDADALVAAIAEAKKKNNKVAVLLSCPCPPILCMYSPGLSQSPGYSPPVATYDQSVWLEA